MSAIFLLAGSFLVGILLSIAVQPQSLVGLFIPSKAILYDSGGQAVYTQNVRLNALALPDNLSLKPGQYTLTVNGVYKDTLQVTGPDSADDNRDNPRPASQAQAPPARVEVKNVNGVQAITWNEKPSQLFSLGDNPFLKQLSGQIVLWLKQERVFEAQLNPAIFLGAVLVALALITFHATALASATVSPANGWFQFFQSGWRYFRYTIVSAAIWSAVLAVVTVPLVGVLNMLGIPFADNIEAGVIAFVVAFLLCRVASVVTGALPGKVVFLCALLPGIITAALAFYPVIPTVFLAALVLFIPAVTGTMKGRQVIESVSGEIVDLADTGTEHYEHEAWRETLQ